MLDWLHSIALDMLDLNCYCVPARGEPLEGEEHENVVEDGHKGPPDLGAAEAVDVEVEGEVEELEVVGHGPEHLEAEVLVELDRVEDGEDRGGRRAAHKQHHDRDQDNYEHPLLGTLEGAPPGGRPGALGPANLRLLDLLQLGDLVEELAVQGGGDRDHDLGDADPTEVCGADRL